jgi:hypothetical protein
MPMTTAPQPPRQTGVRCYELLVNLARVREVAARIVRRQGSLLVSRPTVPLLLVRLPLGA